MELLEHNLRMKSIKLLGILEISLRSSWVDILLSLKAKIRSLKLASSCVAWCNCFFSNKKTAIKEACLLLMSYSSRCIWLKQDFSCYDAKLETLHENCICFGFRGGFFWFCWFSESCPRIHANTGGMQGFYQRVLYVLRQGRCHLTLKQKDTGCVQHSTLLWLVPKGREGKRISHSSW